MDIVFEAVFILGLDEEEGNILRISCERARKSTCWRCAG